MSVSIRKVASDAGVSPMTVSRVLNGRSDQVAPATRDRVLAAVRSLQYVPIAQPVLRSRRGETRIIGLVFDSVAIDGPWGLPTYQGLRVGGLQHNYDLLTLLRARPDWLPNPDEVAFLDRRSDGFVFVLPTNRERVLQTLVEHALPVVTCFTTDVPAGVATVEIDNFGAMEKAVEYLVAHGHRRIAHFAGKAVRSDFRKRREGFCTGMRAAGHDPSGQWIESGFNWQNVDAMADFVMREGITGVACTTDMHALNLWHALEERGLQVPHDVSLISMDNIAEGAARGLTSFQFDCIDLGRCAVDAVVQMIQGASAAASSAVVPVAIIERSSVGPPRRGPVSRKKMTAPTKVAARGGRKTQRKVS